jgi:hypothetical protein
MYATVGNTAVRLSFVCISCCASLECILVFLKSTRKTSILSVKRLVGHPVFAATLHIWSQNSTEFSILKFYLRKTVLYFSTPKAIICQNVQPYMKFITAHTHTHTHTHITKPWHAEPKSVINQIISTISCRAATRRHVMLQSNLPDCLIPLQKSQKVTASEYQVHWF